MKRVYLMRGLPGMGKSTVAKALADAHTNGDPADRVEPVIVSADDYFVQTDGTYAWDRTKLNLAHSQCMSRFDAALKKGVEVVIVDNTNIKRRDFAYYQGLAHEMGYQFFEVAVGNLDVEASTTRNKHGVPRETVERMAREWQP
jgi:predicted kinase